MSELESQLSQRGEKLISDEREMLDCLRRGEQVTVGIDGRKAREVSDARDMLPGERRYVCTAGEDGRELTIRMFDGDPENDAVRLERSVEGHDRKQKRDKSIYDAASGGPLPARPYQEKSW
ncbi:MAG: hypothetical protein ACP5HU_10400 [Phycisphaerae bacterium]